MTTKTEQQVNKNQLAALKATLPAKPTNKNLLNVFIHDGSITSTNGDVVTTIYDESFDDVKFAQIDGKLVTSMIGSLSELNVLDDQRATLNGYEVPISKVWDVEFENFSLDDNKRAFRMNHKQYLDMIANIKAFMAKNDVRYYLNGFNVIVKNKSVTITASTGHTLLSKEVPVDYCAGEYQFTVTRETYTVLAKVKATDVVDCWLGQFQDGVPNVIDFTFFGESMHIKSRLIDHKYPDFTRVFSQHFEHKIRFNRKELLAKLKEIKPLVKLGILLKSDSSGAYIEDGEGRVLCTFVPVHETKDDIEIALNLQYFTDMVSLCTDDEFVLQISSDCSTTFSECNEQKVIVMAMRL